MSEKRFEYGEMISTKECVNLLIELVIKCHSLEKENEQLKKEAKRIEEEKEHFADLYNECCRFKLSDEYIQQAYADLNRREREKHSQGNAKYIAKINQNEVIY